MPITVKSPREIELMTEAGRILEIVHNELGKSTASRHDNERD